MVGVAVVGVLGFVGWDIVSDIKLEIKSEITDAIDEEIAAKRAEITDQATETRIIAKRANEVIQRVENQLDEFEPQAENLRETIEKVKALNVTSQDLIATYSTELQPLVSNVESLSQRLVALAEQVDQLNSLVSAGEPGPGTEVPQATQQRSEAIKSVISDSREAEQRFENARSKATVFFQFAVGRRDQAEALSAALKTKGYIVPGEDREGAATAKHEVRYFHESDREAAERLAEDTTSVLRSLNYVRESVPDVIARPFVTYQGKKPSPGVLELWLEVPAL
jgi:archaellum component FlaC